MAEAPEAQQWFSVRFGAILGTRQREDAVKFSKFLQRTVRDAARVTACAILVAGAASAKPPKPRSGAMQRVEAGVYVPFYRIAGLAPEVAVEPFLLDRVPVTNAEFLEFVRKEPRWQRSQVTELFAEPTYLSHWKSDLELGDAAKPNQPVTFVSWFAAGAYCRSQDKRLPLESEWEWAARFDAGVGEPEEEIKARIFAFYSQSRGEFPAVGHYPPNRFGVQDLHGIIWEWVEDFNTGFASADSRHRGDRKIQRFCGGASEGVRDTSDYASFIRYAMRASLKADYTLHHVGFRCARSIP